MDRFAKRDENFKFHSVSTYTVKKGLITGQFIPLNSILFLPIPISVVDCILFFYFKFHSVSTYTQNGGKGWNVLCSLNSILFLPILSFAHSCKSQTLIFKFHSVSTYTRPIFSPTNALTAPPLLSTSFHIPILYKINYHNIAPNTCTFPLIPHIVNPQWFLHNYRSTIFVTKRNWSYHLPSPRIPYLTISPAGF